MNNREIALVAWVTIGLVFAIWRSNSSLALLSLLRALVARPILIVLTLMSCYVVGIVFYLHTIEWWHWGTLKVTVEWVIGFAIVTVFQIESAQKDPAFFRDVLRNCVNFSAVLAFIASSFTFSLITELVITPIMILIVLLAAFTEGKIRHLSIHRAASALLFVGGLLVVGNSLYRIAAKPSDFATSANAYDFAVPVLLTILFLPFLYVLHIYVLYENAGRRLSYAVKDLSLRRYARLRMMLTFGTNIPGIRRWLNHISVFGASNRSDIERSIAEIVESQRRESNPPWITPPIGWAPHQARQFLASYGLICSDYRRLPDYWQGSSEFLKLGESVFDNTIVYYIQGTKELVTCLTLVLSVDDISTGTEAQARFNGIIHALVGNAIPTALGKSWTLELSADQPMAELSGHQLRLRTSSFDLSGRQSYEVEFEIRPLAFLTSEP